MESASIPPGAAAPPARRASRVKLVALLLLFAAPVIASYLVYYVFPPSGRTNYGLLIEPQRPAPAMRLSDAQGGAQRFDSLLGQWVLLQVDGGACEARCRDKLYAIRQQRTMTGKHRDRIERLWLVDDGAAALLPADFDGTRVLRADAAQLAGWLPTEPGRVVRDYLYIVDPLGNLMMRFPADGDPKLIAKDISRLLRASRVG